MNLPEIIRQTAESIKDEIVEIRRYLHMHPEPSGEEFETAKFIADKLREYGAQVEEGIAGTGVVGKILRGGAGVGMRADMDALPIEEETGLPFASRKSGLMHACGHDGNMACVLGAVSIISKIEEIKGNFLFVFQPHEELPPGGAKRMIEEGVLDGVELSAMLGIHMNPFVEAGKIAIRAGQLCAAADKFTIRVQGAGGHAAYPHRVKDPVPVAGEIITALHRIVSREVNPFDSAVITIARLRAGEEFNVVPDFVEMAGTARSLKEETRERIKNRIEEIVKGIAKAWGMEAFVDYEYGYPPLYNDEGLYEMAKGVVRELFGEDAIAEAKPSMGGEDFAYFGQYLPVLMSYLGVRKGEEVAPFHSSRFDMDDSQLWKGAAFLAGMGAVITRNEKRT